MNRVPVWSLVAAVVITAVIVALLLAFSHPDHPIGCEHPDKYRSGEACCCGTDQ